MRKAQMTRRQAEAMTDELGPPAMELQEHKALVYERHDVYELLADIEDEVLAETNLDYSYRTRTAPEPISTPWMRMSEEERERIRRRRRLRVVPAAASVGTFDAVRRAA